MKKIRILVTITKEYTISIDENIVNTDLIDGYAEVIDEDVKELPDELFSMEEEISKENYPYLNIAKNIAHLKAVHDITEPECMPKVRIVHRDGFSMTKEPTGIDLTTESKDIEYEFDLSESNIEVEEVGA